MSISERARVKLAEIPEGERSLSEQFRVVAKNYVEADKAASLLEETKTAVFSQKVMRHMVAHDCAVNKAEHAVKASDDWLEHLTKMVEARSEANLLKVQLEYIRMRFAEWQSSDANERAERKMSR